MDITHADAQLHGDKSLVACCIERTSLADHALTGETTLVQHDMTHGIQWIRNHNKHRMRRKPSDLLGDFTDDFLICTGPDHRDWALSR